MEELLQVFLVLDCIGEIGGSDFFPKNRLLRQRTLVPNPTEVFFQEALVSGWNPLLMAVSLTGTSMGSGGDILFHYMGTLSTDAVVLKTDSLGELEWVQVLGSSFERPSYGIVELRPDLFWFHIATTSSDHDSIVKISLIFK